MKKKIISLLAPVLCLLMFVSLPANATETHPPRCVDEADILSDDEEMQLSLKLDEISENHQMDVVVVVEDSLDGEEIKYHAADYFDYNGYGIGDDFSGIMLMVSMDEREWFILTTGKGIDTFTDSTLEYMEEDILTYLSSGDYVGAFSEFAEKCDAKLAAANDDADGAYVDDGYEDDGYEEYTEEDIYVDEVPETKEAPGILPSIIIAMVLAIVPVSVMRGQLKSVHMQKGAGVYEKGGSRKITVKRDTFLYHTINRVPKPKEDHTSSGGSTTFRSSSGRSHGGRGGSF